MENYSKEKYPLDSFLITIIVALIAISCFTLYTLQDFLPGDISGNQIFHPANHLVFSR